jgi:hypothetical protein
MELHVWIPWHPTRFTKQTHSLLHLFFIAEASVHVPTVQG